jgi:DNA-binding HxlR family transcriptional regulator
MDFERLRQIDDLLAHRWDVFVLGCLADGPMRFNQLAYEMSQQTRTRLSDSSVSRIKDRLIRAGLVTATADGDGHPAYALTAGGQATAHLLNALTSVLGECQHRDEGKPDSSEAA